MLSLTLSTLTVALALAPEGASAPPSEADDGTAASPAETGEGEPADANTGESETPEVQEPATAGTSSAAAAGSLSTTTATVEATEPPPADPPADAPPTPAKPEEVKPTFTPGVQVFLRGQGRFNADFGYNDNAQDVGEVLERARLQLHSEWGPVSALVQAQDARTWGFEGSTISNEANTDVHQGYLQLGGAKEKLSGWARIGRQEIEYGNQRLIGSLSWAPTARSFDALRLHGEAGIFALDMFGAILAPMQMVSQDFVDDTVDPPVVTTRTRKSFGTQLVGGTATAKIHKAVNVELIMLGLREGPQNAAIAFDRRIGNVGARVFGEPIDGLTYEADGNFQWGKNNRRDHRAWAAHADVRYIYGAKPVKPGARVGYNIASGDCTDPAGETACAEKSSEFFNFYPTNHLFYGYADLLGWRNMRELYGELSVGYEKLVTLEASYHFLQLHDATGRWSNAGGATIHPGFAGNTDHNLGHEIDVMIVYKPWKPIMIQPGYSIFLPDGVGQNMALGDGNGDMAKATSQQFAWLWLVGTF